MVAGKTNGRDGCPLRRSPRSRRGRGPRLCSSLASVVTSVVVVIYPLTCSVKSGWPGLPPSSISSRAPSGILPAGNKRKGLRGAGPQGRHIAFGQGTAQTAGQPPPPDGAVPAAGAADIGAAPRGLAGSVNGNPTIGRTGNPHQFPLGLLDAAGHAGSFRYVPRSGQGTPP